MQIRITQIEIHHNWLVAGNVHVKCRVLVVSGGFITIICFHLAYLPTYLPMLLLSSMSDWRLVIKGIPMTVIIINIVIMDIFR